jgi:hypothetical protein
MLSVLQKVKKTTKNVLKRQSKSEDSHQVSWKIC